MTEAPKKIWAADQEFAEGIEGPWHVDKSIYGGDLYHHDAEVQRLVAEARAERVTVKPLEWQDFYGRGAKANAMLIANYLIDRWSDGRFLISVRAPGYGTGFDGEAWHETLDAAKAAAQADYESRILSALSDAPPRHPDDVAVDRFSAAMKEKLAKKRADGRGGWQDKEDCPQSFLSDLLRGHVDKGDPVDVANFAMMLHQRGEGIAPPRQVTPQEADVSASYLLEWMTHHHLPLQLWREDEGSWVIVDNSTGSVWGSGETAEIALRAALRALANGGDSDDG